MGASSSKRTLSSRPVNPHTLTEPASDQPCHLTSWPADVLDDFVLSLSDPQQLQALSMVCKATRAAVKRLHLPIVVALPVPEARHAAQRVCTAAGSQCSRLRIQGQRMVNDAEESQWQLALMGEALSHPSVRAALKRIKTVEIRGLCLSTLVPSWLPSVGAQVTSLVIKDCTIAPVTETPSVRAPGIRSLHITQLHQPSAQNDGLEALLQSQLSALPGLEDFTYDCAQTIQVKSVRGSDIGQAPCCFLPPVTFSALRHLDISRSHITDADVETLLSMPALREVGFRSLRLTQDFSQRSCQWTQITCEMLQVEQLPLLPLQTLQSLQLRCVEDPQRADSGLTEPRGMLLWAEKVLRDTATTARAAEALSHIPRITIIPPNTLHRSQAADLTIIVCPSLDVSVGFARQLAVFEPLWRALAGGAPATAPTITLQLREDAHFSSAYVQMLARMLLAATPTNVLQRLRLELWQCLHSFNTNERLLHVTRGLPVVLTIRQAALYKALRAVSHAPRGARLVLRVDGRVDETDEETLKEALPAAARRAGVELQVMYTLSKKPKPVLEAMQDAKSAFYKLSHGAASMSKRVGRALSF